MSNVCDNKFKLTSHSYFNDIAMSLINAEGWLSRMRILHTVFAY